MPQAAVKKRPLWYNLSLGNLPAPAILSILHRASGVGLFFGLVWLLYLLDKSLASAASFDAFKSYVSHPVSKVFLLGFAWAYFHHFCAGLRYLVMDVHRATDLKSARATTFTVFAVSLLLTVVVAAGLW